MKRTLIAAAALIGLTACNPRLLIPVNGLNEAIVSGGQAAIDNGNVVDVTGWCGGGTRHLAGHRSTHGSVFGSLPSTLGVGDHVVIYEGAQAKDYVVTSRTREWDCNGVYGDLAIQTSHPDGGTYMWHLRRD